MPIGFIGLAFRQIFILFLLVSSGCTIVISLPDGAKLPGLSGGFGGPYLPRGYGLLNSPASHAFASVSSPVRRGQLAERFELRDGDCGGTDCDENRSRAEIAQTVTASKARLNEDIWYGWSFYNANIGSVTKKTRLGTVVGQWRLEGQDLSILRLIQVPSDQQTWSSCRKDICTKTGSTKDDVVVELSSIAEAYGWEAKENKGRICRLFSMEQMRGKWTDIVMNTNFGTDGYGYLRVWVNGELRCDYQGPMLARNGARKGTAAIPTARRGIFNSYLRDWMRTSKGAAFPTLIAYYDEFLVGQSRAEVDTRLREKAGVRPVN